MESSSTYRINCTLATLLSFSWVSYQNKADKIFQFKLFHTTCFTLDYLRSLPYNTFLFFSFLNDPLPCMKQSFSPPSLWSTSSSNLYIISKPSQDCCLSSIFHSNFIEADTFSWFLHFSLSLHSYSSIGTYFPTCISNETCPALFFSNTFKVLLFHTSFPSFSLLLPCNANFTALSFFIV